MTAAVNTLSTTGAARQALAERSADELIQGFKVHLCPRRNNHDWSACFFYHPGEKARRRDPNVHRYGAALCPSMLVTGSCEKGDTCDMCHNVWDYWLHSDKFRTKLCTEDKCKRTICFFAHGIEELRVPSSSASASLPSSASGTAHSMQSTEHVPQSKVPSSGSVMLNNTATLQELFAGDNPEVKMWQIQEMALRQSSECSPLSVSALPACDSMSGSMSLIDGGILQQERLFSPVGEWPPLLHTQSLGSMSGDSNSEAACTALASPVSACNNACVHARFMGMLHDPTDDDVMNLPLLQHQANMASAEQQSIAFAVGLTSLQLECARSAEAASAANARAEAANSLLQAFITSNWNDAIAEVLATSANSSAASMAHQLPAVSSSMLAALPLSASTHHHVPVGVQSMPPPAFSLMDTLHTQLGTTSNNLLPALATAHPNPLSMDAAILGAGLKASSSLPMPLQLPVGNFSGVVDDTGDCPTRPGSRWILSQHLCG